jgi:hypothetical protein
VPTCRTAVYQPPPPSPCTTDHVSIELASWTDASADTHPCEID